MRAWRLLVNTAAAAAALAVLWVAWNWARLSAERARYPPLVSVGELRRNH